MPVGQDFDEDLQIGAWADAQGTMGVSCRLGFGKARYIETPETWIQDLDTGRV